MKKEVREMKMYMSDSAKLEVEGAYYCKGGHSGLRKYGEAKRGWFLKGKFIGYNFKQALDWLQRNGY